MAADVRSVLERLIKEGEQVRSQVRESDWGPSYLSGEAYEKWIAKSIIFLEKNYPQSHVTKRFVAAAEDASGNSPSYCDTMLGILKALMEMDEEDQN